MARQPLAEVFGFPVDNMAPDTDQHRQNRLCPFNNKVPKCTKDKADDPLGVCSINGDNGVVVTCPIRFRQDWLIARDAASFFFPAGALWTALPEVRLNDKQGLSAGNIDLVLVSHDAAGQITDFGAVEIQAVYISGNVRRPFAQYMQNPAQQANMQWPGQVRPDFLSSSRKRLAPQLLYKGGILNSWRKKMAVVVDEHFFATLPPLVEVAPESADMMWLVYDLRRDPAQNRYGLVKSKAVYTMFAPTLATLTKTEPGKIEDFTAQLQSRLNQRRSASAPISPPTA